MKIEVKRRPATKARKGINPFTKEETIFKAKPAHNVVKIRPFEGNEGYDFLAVTGVVEFTCDKVSLRAKNEKKQIGGASSRVERWASRPDVGVRFHRLRSKN